MVQIDTKIPLGAENNPVGDAQKSVHSSLVGCLNAFFRTFNPGE